MKNNDIFIDSADNQRQGKVSAIIDPIPDPISQDLDFYFYDGVEDQRNHSEVYLYGKVSTNQGFKSACLRV